MPMNETRVAAAVGAVAAAILLVVAGVPTPVAADATATQEGTVVEAERSVAGDTVVDRSQLVPQIEVRVGQNGDGTATVTVTGDGAPVENATVLVAADDEYDGAGTHETDADGRVELPAPDEPVELTVRVAVGGATADGNESDGAADDRPVNDTGSAPAGDDGNATVADDGNATVADDIAATERATLFPDEPNLSVDQTDDGSVVVSVTAAGDPVEGATVDLQSVGRYDGAGTHATDGDGRVVLPPPSETMTATVTLDTAVGRTAVTDELKSENGSPMSLGMSVSSFVDSVFNEDRENGIGREVSERVRENNPGREKRPDHAGDGKPDHAGEGRPDDGDRSVGADAGNATGDADAANATDGASATPDARIGDADGDRNAAANAGSVVRIDAILDDIHSPF